MIHVPAFIDGRTFGVTPIADYSTQQHLHFFLQSQNSAGPKPCAYIHSGYKVSYLVRYIKST